MQLWLWIDAPALALDKLQKLKWQFLALALYKLDRYVALALDMALALYRWLRLWL